jgi:hypothetical protein
MGVRNGFFWFACDVLRSFKWYLDQTVLDEFWLRLLVVIKQVHALGYYMVNLVTHNLNCINLGLVES